MIVFVLFIYLTLDCNLPDIYISHSVFFCCCCCCCYHYVIPFSTFRVGPRQQEPEHWPGLGLRLLECEQGFIRVELKKQAHVKLWYWLHVTWIEYMREIKGQQKLNCLLRAQVQHFCISDALLLQDISSLSWCSSSPFPICCPTTNFISGLLRA